MLWCVTITLQCVPQREAISIPAEVENQTNFMTNEVVVLPEIMREMKEIKQKKNPSSNIN